MNASEERNYHAGFVGGLKILTWPCRDRISFEEEVVLKKQGIRMDLLILKRNAKEKLAPEICRIFRTYNILEYKRPNGDLTIDVFAKVLAYGYLYKSISKTVDAVSYDDLTVTIYRHACPRDLFRQLKARGVRIEEKFPGVYYVTGAAFFQIQVLVGRQLEGKKFAALKVLVPGASEEDIRSFGDVAFSQKDENYRDYVDSVFQVSVSANREIYDRMRKEDPKMCEALKDLMKDELKDEFEKAEEKGRILEAVVIYRDEMHMSDESITRAIMNKFSLSLEDAEAYVM